MAPWLNDPSSTESGSSSTPSTDGSSPATAQETYEPIAIVGMACRWPGDAESGKDVETPSALWDFLQQKQDAYSDFPASRLNIDSWYHPVTNRPGSFYTRGGAFLKRDPREFDPTFFGINPQEATSLDPAQRKFLEVVYEALESSGTPLEKVSGSRTGCFVGNFNYDHQLMQYRDTEYPEPYGITGGGIALLSNRVSYVFNLQGPSMTLDTACSSSMYALHLACSAIQSGECNAAVVGGSNLILTPECQVFSSSLGAVSKSSKCHTFDAAADGYARADGIGALFVKSLRQAIIDGDPIRSIIRGTAINANGRTGGITHPDPDGQERAIRRAYQRAGIDPALTTYFECHGTGTPVGDPLEVEAVARVFADSKTPERPLLIGSIKSNMGHCESASGIAGIMKTVLALEQGVIPPIRILEKLNPNVDLHDGKLKIVEESMLWPEGHLRRASVNSFGYGGANAHTILESIDYLAPGHAGVKSRTITQLAQGQNSGHADRAETSRRKHYLLPFSAHNSQTLKANIDILEPLLGKWDLIDIAYTLSCRRSTLSTRSFIVAKEGEVHDSLISKNRMTYKVHGSQQPSLGFVFTGQGAQWAQMGLELMESFPTYLKSIRDMDDILSSIKGGPSWGIEDSLRASPDSSQVYRAELSQALVTAVQVSLVDLLASWDIRPSVTVGHSSGEIAAVYASGRISAVEAIITAYARGQAVSRNKLNGAMLAVGTGADAIAHHLEQFSSIVVACYNSPESTTLSGDHGEIVSLKSLLDAEKIFARILATDGNAYHSKHMKSLGSWYEDELNHLLSHFRSVLGQNTLQPATFVSSVTGKVYGKQNIGAQYWRTNLESPVLFNQALANLIQTHPVDHVVEVGPHSALQGPIRQISKSLSNLKLPEYLPTLVRREDGAENLLALAGTLFAKGYKVNLGRVNTIEALDSITNSVLNCNVGSVVVDLPKYQWSYSDQFYFENRWTREWRTRSHPRHDILGSRTPGGNWKEPIWRNMLKQKDLPWLQDHKIGTDVVFPTSAYLSMAVEAATQVAEINQIDSSMIQRYELYDVHLSAALIIPESGSIEVLFNLHSTKLNSSTYYSSKYDFTITSVVKSGEKDIFTEHAHGQIALILGANDELPKQSSALPGSLKHLSSSQWYDAFERVGLNYGPTFRGLSDIQISSKSNAAQSRVNLCPTSNLMNQESRYVIHPAALDSTLQLAILAGHDGRASKCETGFLPVAIERLTLWPSKDLTPIALATAHANQSSSRELSVDITLATINGQQILTGSKLVLVRAEMAESGSSSSVKGSSPFTRMAWKPDFDLLAAASLQTLYPTTFRDNGVAELSILDQLALHQTVQFNVSHPEFFANGSSIPHLQRFLSWMTEKVKLARADEFRDGVKICNYSINERNAEIERLELALMAKNGPETRLMCHMFRALPAIYRGEITGIQAAVQDHLLDDMYAHMRLYHQGSTALKDLVVLLSHKNPKLKILEIGGGTGSATREVLPALRGDTEYRGYDSYTFTDIGPAFLAAAQTSFKEHKGVLYAPFDMQVNAQEQGFDSDYDLIIASNVIHATTNIHDTLVNVRRLLKPGGKLVLFEFVQPRLSWNMILGTFSDFWNGDEDPVYPRTEGPFLTRSIWKDVLPRSGFNGVDMMLDHFAQQGEAAIIMTTASEVNPPIVSKPESRSISLVYRRKPSLFILDFTRYLQSSGVIVQLFPLSQVINPENGRFIVAIEADEPFFSGVTSDEWENLKTLVLKSHSALYITRGGLLDGGNPEFAMISGMVCAIHTEMQSSRLVTVDLDQDESCQEQDFANLARLEKKANNYSLGEDFEYRSKRGVVHVSRLESDEGLNEEVQLDAIDSATPALTPLAQLRQHAMVMSTEQMGTSRQFYFEENALLPKELDDEDIEIEAMAFDLDDPVSGNSNISNVDSKLSGGGFAGIITRVGSVVAGFEPGDKVYGLHSSNLSTLVRTKQSFCIKMSEADSFEEMAAIPSAYCSAVYGLIELGGISKGDIVLVQSATSSIGLAACHIARLHGAELFVTAEPGDQHYLQSEFGINEDHVFSTAIANTADTMLERTKGLRFNVILSGAQGEEMHQYWQCIAPYGRFIDLGRSEAFQNGRLSMKMFQENASFASFDMLSLSKLRPATVARMMQKINTLHVNGSIKPFLRLAFSVSDIEDVFSEEMKIEGPGSIVVTFDSAKDSVKVRRASDELTFAPEASYILVGCLGGLGRSFAEWMVSRGAKKLTFLSRTGATGQEAQDFLSQLQIMGVDAQVIKGNVTSSKDVEYAVKSCVGPIKGIVQAALTLHDSFFSNMMLEDFKSTMEPRVKGTLNLHHASKDMPLDFFLTWSSWTTIFGSASQSNYMASSSFMDAFANHRRSQNLPATSLGLGQILDVGIVSYHPQFQENLLRMGLYGNTEADFLHYCKTSILHSSTPTDRQPSLIHSGHLLAGVEPAGLLRNDKRYPLASMSWHRDPRFSLLIQATTHLTAAANDSASPTLAGDNDDNPAEEPALRIHRKLSRLLYVAREDIDTAQPIKTYGIDSMVAGELRNWLFTAFGVEVSLLSLLHPGMTVQKLAGVVGAGSGAAAAGEEKE